MITVLFPIADKLSSLTFRYHHFPWGKWWDSGPTLEATLPVSNRILSDSSLTNQHHASLSDGGRTNSIVSADGNLVGAI